MSAIRESRGVEAGNDLRETNRQQTNQGQASHEVRPGTGVIHGRTTDGTDRTDGA